VRVDHLAWGKSADKKRKIKKCFFSVLAKTTRTPALHVRRQKENREHQKSHQLVDDHSFGCQKEK